MEKGSKIIVLNNKRSPCKKKIFKECFSFSDVYEGHKTLHADKKLFETNKGVTTDYFQSIIVIENPSPIKWYWEDFHKKITMSSKLNVNKNCFRVKFLN